MVAGPFKQEEIDKLVTEAVETGELYGIFHKVYILCESKIDGFPEDMDKDKISLVKKQIRSQIFASLNEMTESSQEKPPREVLEILFRFSGEIIDNIIIHLENVGIDINMFNKKKSKEWRNVFLTEQNKIDIVEKITGYADRSKNEDTDNNRTNIEDYDFRKSSYKTFLFNRVCGHILNIFKKKNINEEFLENVNKDGEEYSLLESGNTPVNNENQGDFDPAMKMLKDFRNSRISEGIGLVLEIFKQGKLVKNNCKEILTLFLVNKTYQEIKEILGLDIKIASIRMRKRRCLQMLKKAMEARGYYGI